MIGELVPLPSWWPMDGLDTVIALIGAAVLAQTLSLAWKNWRFVQQMSRHEKGSGLLLFTFSLLDVYLLLPLIGWPVILLLYGVAALYFVRKSVELAEAGRIGYMFWDDPPDCEDLEE
jgi:hypothetical protein